MGMTRHYQPLSPDEIADALCSLPDWEFKEAWLRKTFTFGSFDEAVQFINRVAQASDGLSHHPDIYVRFRTVVLILQTHQANHQVTAHDVQLARAIENLNSAL